MIPRLCFSIEIFCGETVVLESLTLCKNIRQIHKLPKQCYIAPLTLRSKVHIQIPGKFPLIFHGFHQPWLDNFFPTRTRPSSHNDKGTPSHNLIQAHKPSLLCYSQDSSILLLQGGGGITSYIFEWLGWTVENCLKLSKVDMANRWIGWPWIFELPLEWRYIRI
jgi:hypothetical protein